MKFIPSITVGALLVGVAWAQPTITTSSPLASGTVGVFYSTTLSCTNCANGVWGASGLPANLSINSSSGTISGTPTTPGTYGKVVVSLQVIGAGTVTKVFSITINAPPLSITSTSFPAGTVNVQYPTQTLSASGGVAPYSWSVSTGLPPGLGINGATILGTPTTVGTYAFVLTVFDSLQNTASAQVSIVINGTGGGAAINTTALPNGTSNVPYTAQLACTSCQNYTWSVSSGTLPQGLQINGQSGIISGTPAAAGASTFQVSLTPPSTLRGFQTVTQILSITINLGGLAITTTTLPVGSVSAPYSATLAATGGTPPYSWSLTSTANDGLTIGATSGVISGTPTATGQFTLSVLLTDSQGLTASRIFTITISAALSILTTTLPAGSVNVVYPTQTLTAGGGQPPYRWIIVTTGPGNLPPGLTLDGVFGRISGTPTASGTFPFELMVTDNNSNSATATLSITVGGNIVITPATLPNASVNTAYSQTLSANGGTAPYNWAVTAGSLPVGLTLGAATGVISGTPALPDSATFTVTATDSNKITGQAAYTLTVSGPVTITTTSLPDGTIGTPYSQTLAATGGTTPYTWAVTTGTLPAGLTLAASTGVISGTPTGAATSSFTVTVTDAGKVAAKQALSIATATALTVTPTTLPAATVGTAFTQKFTAAGGKAPYTFALTGTLPAGFTFAASTATIAGTAAVPESGAFTITVTDASGRIITLPLTLTATVAPLSITPTTLAELAGVPFSAVFQASGGIQPYTYSQGLGALPTGVTFNASTQTLAAVAGAVTAGFNFNIVVTDSSGSAGTQFPIVVTVTNPPSPTVTLAVTGPSSSGFAQQIPYSIGVGSAYPLPISGSVTLSFAPSVTPSTGVDDQMIQFASGGTCTTAVPHTCTLNFAIPANSLTITPNTFTVLTGTTAGTITLTTSMTAGGVVLTAPQPTKIVNNSGVPFISSVSFQQTPGGITVTVVGFSSSREMVSGLFHFAPANNVTFTSGDITVPLATPFSTWWSNTTQSNPYGTQFTLTAPFSLSTQSTSVVSVTVTLTNSKGASNPVTLAQ